MKARKIVPYFVTHKGCPHTCTFCNQRVINAHCSSGLKDFEAFITKSITLWQKTEPQQLAFFGGSFTALEGSELLAYLELGKGLIDQGIIHSLRCSTRPDAINDHILDTCIRHGMEAIELGVQSLTPQVLVATERGYLVETVARASAAILQRGLELGHQLMIGLPLETFESFKQTVMASIDMHPHTVRLYPTQVLKHTELEKQYASGSYTPLSLDESLAWTTWALGQYRQAGIKVIKIGLQANEALMDPDVRLAGPYHPAYGEWVESLMAQKAIEIGLTQLKNCNIWPPECSSMPRGNLIVYCNNRNVSRFVGLSKINVAWASDHYGVHLQVHALSSVGPGEFILNYDNVALCLPLL